MNHCALCGVPIVDPTSQVVHADENYCCANCASAAEQRGSGSDPDPLGDPGDSRCAHCGVRIVDDSTMESRGDATFCCANCARASQQRSAA